MNKLFNTLFWTVTILAVMAVLLRIILDDLNKREESIYAGGGKTVSVRYHAAEAGSDKIFGYRVPYGIVWRTGSGDATVIRFSEDGYFGGKKVKAGAYSLWSIPSEKEWVLILNSEVGQYGTRYDAAQDYLRVTVPAVRLPERQESLSLRITGGARAAVLQIRWENTLVEAEIR